MEYIYGIIKKKASAFDNKWFLNSEKNQTVAARFFYSSSFVTRFFLFSQIGKILVSILAATSFYLSCYYFRIGIALFADLGIRDGIQYMMSNIPLILIVFIVFTIFLMDLTLINTFLVCCPSVSYRIRFLYGENFLKQQYYNHALTSAKAAAQMSKHVAIGLAGGIIGGAVTNIYGERVYSDLYTKYLEAQTANPNISIVPPKKGVLGFSFGK